HVVPPEPPGGRLLHRVFPGRAGLYPDAHLPPAGGRRARLLRRLCLFAGGFPLHRLVQRSPAGPLPVEGPRRPAAGRRNISSIRSKKSSRPSGLLLLVCGAQNVDQESESSLSTAVNASLGRVTLPSLRIFFLPSFCFSSSFFLRVMSPP